MWRQAVVHSSAVRRPLHLRTASSFLCNGASTITSRTTAPHRSMAANNKTFVQRTAASTVRFITTERVDPPDEPIISELEKHQSEEAIDSGSTSAAETPRRVQTTEQLAQTLLSYKSLNEALGHRQEAAHSDWVSHDLLNDIFRVVNHYAKQPWPIREETAAIPDTSTKHTSRRRFLSRQLGYMLHTLILPDFDMPVPSQYINQVLRAAVLTLRTFARDAAHPGGDMSIEDANMAQDLLYKLMSIRIYYSPENAFTEAGAMDRRKSLLVAFNSILGMWAELSGSLNDMDARRIAIQNAEYLLLVMGQSTLHHVGALSPPPPERLLSTVMPDIVSFNTVMTGWGKFGKRCKHPQEKEASAERAQALLRLLLDLFSDQQTPTKTPADNSFNTAQSLLLPTSRSYDAVLRAYTDSGGKHPQAPDRAMSLLYEMVDRHEKLPNQPAPTVHTFAHVFNVLAKAQLKDVRPRIREVMGLMERLGILPTTVVCNTALSAYYRSKPESLHEHCRVCQEMDDIVYRMETSNPEAQPDNITYRTVLNAWVDCAKRSEHEGNSDMVTTCAKHAERHLQAAINTNVGIDIRMFQNVMSALASQPQEAERLFALAKTSPNILPNLETYTILIDAFHKATTRNKVEYAAAAEQYLWEMEQLVQNEGRNYLRPDTRCFNAVIMAWVASQTPQGCERAAAVLNRMCTVHNMELNAYQQDRSFRIMCRPNTTSFMHVLSAFSRNQQKHTSSIKIVEDLIRRMEDMTGARQVAPNRIGGKMANVEPNIVTYNLLLDMYARHREPSTALASKAEAQVERLESSKNKEFRPDKFTYSALMKVYGRTDGSSSRILALLDRARGDPKLARMFDTWFYNTALGGIGYSGEEGAIEKAEAVLTEMESGVYGEHVQPDELSYRAIISVLKRLGSYEGAQRAEKWLNRYEERSRTSTKCDMRACYNNVISAYALTGTPEGASRAGQLLQHMEEQHQAGNNNLIPDCITYNTVMSVSTSQRAQELFEHMKALYVAGAKGAKPNALTFSNLINAWVRSDEESAPERAEEALRQKDAFRSEDDSVFATTIDYQVVLTRWGTSGVQDGPERSEALLEEMVSKYESGLSMAAPDMDTYMRVLLNFSDRATPIAAQKAQDLLDRMAVRHERSGEGNPKPSHKCVTICMRAWAKTGEAGCDANAEALMNRFTEISDDSDKELLDPDFGMYSAILLACVTASKDPATVDGTSPPGPLERGIRIFTVMRESDNPRVHPNHSTFGYMFQIIHKHMHEEDPRRIPLLEKLFQQCCKDGHLSNPALESFLAAAPPAVSRQALGIDETTDLRMLRIEDLPAEWRRNDRKEEQLL